MDVGRQRFSFRFATGLLLVASVLALCCVDVRRCGAFAVAVQEPAPTFARRLHCRRSAKPQAESTQAAAVTPAASSTGRRSAAAASPSTCRAGAKTTGPNDPRAVSSKPLSIPGASSAVLTTYKDKTKRLYALYPQGIVGITAIVDTTLSDAEMVAVMRLITHT